MSEPHWQCLNPSPVPAHVPRPPAAMVAEPLPASCIACSYLKLDWCIKADGTDGSDMRTPAVRQKRTTGMAHAMNKTGRPMWLTFHCTWEHAGSTPGTHGSFQDWCAEDGNSWRIGACHVASSNLNMTIVLYD